MHRRKREEMNDEKKTLQAEASVKLFFKLQVVDAEDSDEIDNEISKKLEVIYKLLEAVEADAFVETVFTESE